MMTKTEVPTTAAKLRVTEGNAATTKTMPLFVIGSDSGDDDEAVKKAAADKAAAEEAARKKAEDAITAQLEELKSKGVEALAAELKKLADEKADLLRETMKRKGTIDDLAKKIAEFDGLDPKELKELQTAKQKAEADAKKAEEENLKKAGDWDRLKAMMADEHKKQVEELNGQVTTFKTSLEAAHAQIAELTVGQAFAQSKFIAGETVLPVAAARQVFGAHFDTADDGSVIAYDKPRGAKDRTMLVDSAGRPMAFEAAIAKLVDASPDRDSLKRTKMAPGANSRTDNLRPGDNKGEDGSARGLARITKSLDAGALKQSAKV